MATSTWPTRRAQQRLRRDHEVTDVDPRRACLHMIEEYARHNGHADVIREHIDGITGQQPSQVSRQHPQ